jgi:hypothetical protein
MTDVFAPQAAKFVQSFNADGWANFDLVGFDGAFRNTPPHCRVGKCRKFGRLHSQVPERTGTATARRPSCGDNRITTRELIAPAI